MTGLLIHRAATQVLTADMIAGKLLHTADGKT